MSSSLSQYSDINSSFSGTDMVAVFEIPMPDGKAINRVIGSLQSITYSIHNEKIPVRTLGDMNMKNVVFGGRIIAGSMVFTVFNRHWLREMMSEFMTYVGDVHYLMDEIPPLNVTISMSNEYGQEARLSIYGVTFVNEGQAMSVNDMYTENTFEYYARDIDYLGAVDSSAKYSSRANNEDVKNLPEGKRNDVTVSVDTPAPKNAAADSDTAPGEDILTEEEKDTGGIYEDYGQAYGSYFTGDEKFDYKTQSKKDYFGNMSSAYSQLLKDIDLTNKTGELSEVGYARAKRAARIIYEAKIKEASDYYSANEGNQKAEGGSEGN